MNRELLRDLWRAHSSRPFPEEWNDLEEIFGSPAEIADVRRLDSNHKLTNVWGDPDLRLYDSYVAGYVESVLAGGKSGAETIGDAPNDDRLALYLEYCIEHSTDERVASGVRRTREYLNQLNELLDVARDVQARET